MSSAVSPGGASAALAGDERTVAREVGHFWWLWLVTGAAWSVAALVILQFDSASIATVGIIVGCMFVFSGVQQLMLAAVGAPLRWLWAVFGVLFLIAGVICFLNPKNTFAAMADILGFLFLTVGVWWTMAAFLERDANPIWWLGLVTGIMMIVLAFWTSGQFFFHKAYTLLVFAGVWALMHGINDIVRAFKVRGMRDAV